jgi:acyl-CoA thioester hydrolase
LTEIFELRLNPQYYDFDPSGIAHNVVYIRWLEDGRLAFQSASPWPPERLYASDIAAVLTRTEILYKRPIRLSDPVVLRVWVTQVGKSVLSLSLRFFHPETGLEYARAEQTGCFVRLSTGRPQPMPAEFADFCRASLARFGLPD